MGRLFLFRLKKSISGHSTTHECFAVSLMIGQCFAMFPLEGLLKSDFRLLRFRWISWCTIYTMIYVVGIMFLMGFHINNAVCAPKLVFDHFVTLAFYLSTLVSTLLFIRLARCWPQLMQKWVEIDFRMHPAYGFSKTLSLRLKVISAVVLLGALLEHGLYLASAITNITDKEGWDKVLFFLQSNFGYIFRYFSFGLWKAIILFILNIMCTFTWNYMDLVVMLISTTLAVKFKQITSRVKAAVTNRVRDILFWRELRTDYNVVAGLCNNVDNSICDIILLSFANNLFFILVQLFNSLRPRNDNTIGRVYFMYSFTFLLIRTIAVSLYAASINESSRKPTALLLSVPPEVYNVEIERFLYKIEADPCALTGKHFFNVTKSLILNVAGAIVTYELVLIQFNTYVN